jgi:putative ABC transport system ATP-binding protein
MAELAGETDATVLEAMDLYRFFPTGTNETLALRGVSLSVNAGEFVAITGASGSGKSTLLHILAGLDEPDAGWVAIGGHRLTRQSESVRARMRAQSIGILLQSGNLLGHFTIDENLALAASFAETARPVSSDLLASMGMVGHGGARPHELSGGELARASLAVALVNNPPILLADEPTGEVDGETETLILDLLMEQTRRGCTAIVVTHSPAVAAMATHRIELVDGKVGDSYA